MAKIFCLPFFVVLLFSVIWPSLFFEKFHLIKYFSWVSACLLVVGVVFVEDFYFVFFGKILCRLGDSSYSLYLSHIFVVLFLMKIWAKIDFIYPIGFLIFCVIVSVLFSAVVYGYMEAPINVFLKRRRSASTNP
ncbi:hypothetical protein [Sphaerotilus hippei]|uniref:hypothetical protein n=1 Tax=Sphaerotilus hippei TaxID=744406 RepID=UPI0011B6ECD8|nr:hypothetical protein [Sphaerotilus hippei]